jgi:hypothetical protein
MKTNNISLTKYNVRSKKTQKEVEKYQKSNLQEQEEYPGTREHSSTLDKKVTIDK